MSYKEILDKLKRDVISDIMSLFDRNTNDTVRANSIKLTSPYIFTLEYYHPDEEDTFEKVMITGMFENGDLISKNMDGEERSVFFDDLCADDLVNLHELFTRNHIYYVFT
jgi:hypothetical protein